MLLLVQPAISQFILDEYLLVPPQTIGIISTSDDRSFLKALSLFLSSDFAFYHQFLSSSQFGVQQGLATLDALKDIPVPIANLSNGELKKWLDLHTKLVQATVDSYELAEEARTPLFRKTRQGGSIQKLTKELNDIVNDSLGLDQCERALIHDLVHVRLALNDGKVGPAATRCMTTRKLTLTPGGFKRN